MEELILAVNNDLETEFSVSVSNDDLFKKIATFINDLIIRDFQKLLFVLYRLDINEKKLEKLLEESDTDAGTVIANLIIERELQKMESRKKYKSNADIPDEEKW